MRRRKPSGVIGGSTTQTVSAMIHDLAAAEHELEVSPRLRRQNNRKADALVLMAEALLQSTTTTSSSADRYQVVVHVDRATLSGGVSPSGGAKPVGKPAGETSGETIEDPVGGPAGEPDCYIEQESAIPVETARRLCCDAKLVAMLEENGDVLSVGRRTRAIPPSLRRALRRRDGRCQFPGCSATRFVDAHHIQHWADGGETELDNLTELCRHHHRLVHEGGFGVARHGGELQFTRPDGSKISQAAPTCKSEQPLDDQDAKPWQCHGGPMDYGMALSALHSRTMRSDAGSAADRHPEPHRDKV